MISGRRQNTAAGPAAAIAVSDGAPSFTAAALGKVEQIELSPLALTQLRITLFPWTTGTQKDDKL